MQVFLNALGLLLRVYLRGRITEFGDSLKILANYLTDKVRSYLQKYFSWNICYLNSSVCRSYPWELQRGITAGSDLILHVATGHFTLFQEPVYFKNLTLKLYSGSTLPDEAVQHSFKVHLYVISFRTCLFFSSTLSNSTDPVIITGFTYFMTRAKNFSNTGILSGTWIC